MIEIFEIELLNRKVQQSIKEIKIESFIFNELVTEVNSIYIKFDSWISLFFDDGMLFINEGLGDKQRRIESGGDIVEYKYLDTIEHIITFNDINEKKLIEIIKDNLGLRLVFENHKELIINQHKLNNGEFKQPTIEIKDRL